MPESNVVSVFGSSGVSGSDAAYEQARAVGRTLAELGYCVANGGYGGTMEASARGAKDAGGKTIGVVCSIWSRRPNQYIDRRVETDNLRRRLETLIELGQAGYVVLPGATGTLTELAMVWEMTCKGILPLRPIVCVGAFWRPLMDMMSAQHAPDGVAVAVASAGELGQYFLPCQRS